MTANKITKQILQYLTLQGHYVFRVNNIPAGRRSNTIHKGIPDIMGVSKNGNALAIEIKTTDKQSIDQMNFETKWIANKGIYILAHDLDDVIGAGL